MSVSKVGQINTDITCYIQLIFMPLRVLLFQQPALTGYYGNAFAISVSCRHNSEACLTFALWVVTNGSIHSWNGPEEFIANLLQQNTYCCHICVPGRRKDEEQYFQLSTMFTMSCEIYFSTFLCTNRKPYHTIWFLGKWVNVNLGK